MARKRRILEALPLRDLQELVGLYEIEVEDRRVRDQLVDRLSRAHRVDRA